MASLFKRFKKTLPASTSKGSTYYERENTIGNLDDLKKVLEGAPKIPSSKTDVEITFNNIPLNEITLAGLKKKFGAPAYVHKNELIDGHAVLFYRESVNYYKFLIQYHFINNKFFFASNKISSMGVLNDDDINKILSRISNKYLNKEFKDKQGRQMKVTDPNGSIIYTFDDVYFHLLYLVNNETTRNLIEKYADHTTQHFKPSGFKESLDQFI